MNRNLIAINSEDRDSTAFPNASNFRLTLDNTINNVIGIRLLQSEIPVSEFNIREDNNTFTITELLDTPITVGISVPEGDYDSCSLITEIQELLNTNSNLTGTYTLSLTNGKVSISSDVSFEIEFSDEIKQNICKSGHTYIPGSNSIARVLGFTECKVYSTVQDTQNVLQAPNKINLQGPRVIYLHIKHGSTQISQILSQSQGGRGALFRIQLDAPHNCTAYYQNQDCCSYYYKCAPIAKLKELTFELKTESGRYYSTSGIPWSILIEIEQNTLQG